MLQKINEAIRIFTANFGLLSVIILTVWLPGNLIISAIDLYYPIPEEDLMRQISRDYRISNFIELAFGPLYTGALVYSIAQIKQGRMAKYGEAFSAAFQNWGKIFTARLWAGLIILAGFIAFIIPGIIMSLRYALVDNVAMLEGARSSVALKRSAQLTKGKRWQILGTGILTIIGWLVFLVVVSLVVYIPLEIINQSDNVFVEFVLGCVLNVTSSIINIVLFLFYWEAREEERN